MRPLLTLLAIVFALLACLPPAAAGDAPILQTWKKRFTKDAYLSEREEVLQALVAAASPAARDAILVCLGRSREYLDDAQKESDKCAAAMKPLQA